jgi:hypothetical protein
VDRRDGKKTSEADLTRPVEPKDPDAVLTAVAPLEPAPPSAVIARDKLVTHPIDNQTKAEGPRGRLADDLRVTVTVPPGTIQGLPSPAPHADAGMSTAAPLADTPRTATAPLEPRAGSASTGPDPRTDPLAAPGEAIRTAIAPHDPFSADGAATTTAPHGPRGRSGPQPPIDASTDPQTSTASLPPRPLEEPRTNTDAPTTDPVGPHAVHAPKVPLSFLATPKAPLLDGVTPVNRSPGTLGAPGTPEPTKITDVPVAAWRESPVVKNWQPEARDVTFVGPTPKAPLRAPKLRDVLVLTGGAGLLVAGLYVGSLETTPGAGPTAPTPIERPPGELMPIAVKPTLVAPPPSTRSALDEVAVSPRAAAAEAAAAESASSPAPAAASSSLAVAPPPVRTMGGHARCVNDLALSIDGEASWVKENGKKLVRISLVPRRSQLFRFFVARAAKTEGCALDRVENEAVRLDAYVLPDKPTAPSRVVFDVECGGGHLGLEVGIDPKELDVHLREVPLPGFGSQIVTAREHRPASRH